MDWDWPDPADYLVPAGDIGRSLVFADTEIAQPSIQELRAERDITAILGPDWGRDWLPERYWACA